MAQVLLIEDDHQVQQVLESFLHIKGHSVTTASNGKVAIQKITTFPGSFDLVITDIVMPESDGFEVIRFIGTMDNPPKVIAMSGGGVYLDHDLLLRIADHMKVEAVLQKPVMRDVFDDTVSRVLSSSSS